MALRRPGPDDRRHRDQLQRRPRHDAARLMPPEIVTFGCRLNTYESEVMRGHARDAGLENAIVFNTCAVTAEAERQARQALPPARRENPAATIIVPGYAAQTEPAAFPAMPAAHRVPRPQQQP